MSHFIIICFDIANDRRRRQVAKILEDHGLRVQFSVFECHLKTSELNHLKQELGAEIDEFEDHIRYYSLCHKDESAVIVDGRGRITTDPEFHFV